MSYLGSDAPTETERNSMSLRETLTVLSWLISTAAAVAISSYCVLNASAGMLSGFALVPLLWSVALGTGFVHHLKASLSLSTCRGWLTRLYVPRPVEVAAS
jgi:hypothetical protein